MTDRIDSRLGRGVLFVPAATTAPPIEGETAVVVLDTAWTPATGDRPDLLGARSMLSRVIERRDLFEEALARLDAWADAAQLPDRLLVEGVTYWYRMRETTWHWLHERLLWRHALRSTFDDAISFASVPRAEEALADVIRCLGVEVRGDANHEIAESGEAVAVVKRASPSGAGRFESLLSLVRGRPGRAATARQATEWRRREEVLAERVGQLSAGAAPRVIVLTIPATYQQVRGADNGGRRDPNLGSVIPRLREAGFEPVLIGMGLDQRVDEDWHMIERDPTLLPQVLIRTRWAAAEDGARVAAALASVEAPLAEARSVPLEVDGIDLAGPLVDALRATVVRIVTSDVHQLARAERLLDELRPSAMILSQEGIRTPWLVAGADAGVPVAAVQHGVLYRTHPGYPPRRHPASVLPTRTFVYGDYERRVLLDGAYRAEEVEVSGSPRLDLDADTNAGVDSGSTPWGEVERERVRRELGVASGDRLLVVSTLHLAFVRRSHLVHMLEATLGGPLPRTHLVFKQHPGEGDAGPYRALLEGLARAGGYPAPPMTVVKDIDLYRLLRAADAHLGMHSTVLTDAVAAGTPNLIALVEGHADILGYVAAGVARPVRDVDDVRDALADPWPTDPVARKAFLDDHFRSGDASARIVETIRRSLEPLEVVRA